MKMISKLTKADMHRLYELGYQKMNGFLGQGKNLNEVCAAIDEVMPTNINMWLDTIPGGNPLVSGQEVEIDGNTLLLLHHTAHFFMTVAIGMAIEYNLLDEAKLIFGRGNDKVS